MAKRQPKQKTENDINNILVNRYRLKCKNQKQKVLANLITEKEIIITTGPAGVGKSFVAIARAIELLQNVSNQYKKIILINPAVEAEEKYGYIPGSMREKLDPFVAPSIDIVDKIIGSVNRVKLEEGGILSVDALGHIRGKSIDNTILIMEEAQNMSPNQMKTLLTRIGYNSKFIISGDLDQSDRYKDFRDSGLYDATNKHKNIEAFGFMEFNESDIVRNPLISLILDNYKKDVKLNKINQEKDIKTRPKISPEYLSSKEEKSKNTLIIKLKIWFKKNFKW